jgi:hypothetical protein
MFSAPMAIGIALYNSGKKNDMGDDYHAHFIAFDIKKDKYGNF